MRFFVPFNVAVVLFALLPSAIGDEWDTRLGTENDTELARSACSTMDGGVAIVGSAYDGNYGGVYVARLTGEGTLVWETRLAPTDMDQSGYQIVQTDDGGFCVFATASIVGKVNRAPWLIRLDGFGQVLWSTYDGFTSETTLDSGYVVGTQLEDGSFVVAGSSTRYENFAERWVAKIAADGSLISEETFPALLPGWYSYTNLYDAEPTPDGGLIITGGAGSYPGTTLLWKLDNEGSEEWVRTYEDEILLASAHGITVTKDGGYLIAGTTPSYLHQSTLARFDQGGDFLWASAYGDSDLYTRGEDVLESDNGNIILLRTSTTAVAAQNVRTDVLELDASGNVLDREEIEGGRFATNLVILIFGTDGDYIALGYRNDIGPCAQLDVHAARRDVGDMIGEIDGVRAGPRR